MTLPEFKALIVSADPKATRYFAADTGACTVWAEYERTSLDADDGPVETVWKIRVDRYTTAEDDPVAAAISEALYDNDEIAVKGYTVATDVETRYIRHTWLCEVV
jgi:hypothetical protein